MARKRTTVDLQRQLSRHLREVRRLGRELGLTHAQLWEWLVTGQRPREVDEKAMQRAARRFQRDLDADMRMLRVDPAEVRRALARPIPETIRVSPRVVIDGPTREHIREIERVALQGLRAREREEQRLRKLLGIGPDADLRIAQAKTRCVCGCSFTAHAIEKPHPCRVVRKSIRHGARVEIKASAEAHARDPGRCRCTRFRRARKR